MSETQEVRLPDAPVHDQPGTVALSAREFSALEERVLKAVELLKRERQARTEAEARAAEAESRVEKADTQLREHEASADELRKEVSTLRGERNEVKQRVERLLSQLDTLEL
jgi:chromosome segregation ATPase